MAAKRKQSSQKREREFKKRERQRRKAEQAAQKRERRFNRGLPDAPDPAEDAPTAPGQGDVDASPRD